MTSSALPAPVAGARARRSSASPVVRATAACLLLGMAVAARWAVTTSGSADGVAVGAVFGTVLLASAAATGWRPSDAGWLLRPLGDERLAAPRRARLAGGWLGHAMLGLAAGLALVGISLATRWPGPWVAFDPAPSFAPWAAVTVLVAVAEEAILRGALFDAVEEGGGAALAIGVTAAAFALLHVPLYGWHVVPLDLGVGLLFGGLRILGGGIAAPAVAHVVADIATWWM